MPKLTRANAIPAWHFLPADHHTRFEPRELVTNGSVLVFEGTPELCERGLHASVRAIDALQYAPGPVVCRVNVWGEVLTGDDKIVGTHRECVSMVDATNVLHEFACCVAEAALLLAEVKDQHCWNAIEAKRAWLRGEIDDRDLDAAWDAAWAAAKAAAWAAAWAAAKAAAWDAAWDEQNTTLEGMLIDALRKAK